MTIKIRVNCFNDYRNDYDIGPKYYGQTDIDYLIPKEDNGIEADVHKINQNNEISVIDHNIQGRLLLNQENIEPIKSSESAQLPKTSNYPLTNKLTKEKQNDIISKVNPIILNFALIDQGHDQGHDQGQGVKGYKK